MLHVDVTERRSNQTKSQVFRGKLLGQPLGLGRGNQVVAFAVEEKNRNMELAQMSRGRNLLHDDLMLLDLLLQQRLHLVHLVPEQGFYHLLGTGREAALLGSRRVEALPQTQLEGITRSGVICRRKGVFEMRID